MADPILDADVQAFLRDRIESYEQLEILVLLRARRGEALTPSAVALELHISESDAELALRALCRQGLLNVMLSPDLLLFRYQPQNPELAALGDRLTSAYAERRLEVVRLMTANSIERLRARALKTFANAFLLGKKGGKDG